MKKKKRFSKEAIYSAINDPFSDQEDSYALPEAPAVAPATNTALLAGGNPKILDQAKRYLDDQNYIGLCERFVEKVTKGATGLFPSAIAAWQGQQDKASTDLSQLKAGDSLYFAPDQSNGGYGHTGIYEGNGNMISATNSGVKSTPLDKWVSSTGQKVLGFIRNG